MNGYNWLKKRGGCGREVGYLVKEDFGNREKSDCYKCCREVSLVQRFYCSCYSRVPEIMK